MAEINNKPALRFAGFTEAWEQRKLKDFVENATTEPLKYPNMAILTMKAFAFMKCRIW